jgi:hypothetical protein
MYHDSTFSEISVLSLVSARVGPDCVSVFGKLTKEDFILFLKTAIFGVADAVLYLFSCLLDVPIVGETLRLTSSTLVVIVGVKLERIVLSFCHSRQKKAIDLFSSDETGLKNFNYSTERPVSAHRSDGH